MTQKEHDDIVYVLGRYFYALPVHLRPKAIRLFPLEKKACFEWDYKTLELAKLLARYTFILDAVNRAVIGLGYEMIVVTMKDEVKK